MKQSLRWLSLALCTVLAGCNKPDLATTGNNAKPDAGKKVRLAFITNNASDFWTIAQAGCKKASDELPNVDLDFKIPGDGTAATQKSIVDDLLARGVDGIAISPVDPKNQTTMLNEIAKNCLLFTHDSDAPASNRACYIGTDNTAAGKQAGDLIKKALPNGGKIMVFVGTLDAQNAHDRFGGIKDALTGSNVEIIDIRTDDTDHVRAKANALDTIVQYPDVAALVGLWSYNGPAIVSAVQEANKVGAIKVVCFDEEEGTLQGIRDGVVFSTVVQQPFEFGYQAIKLMDKVASGDKSAIPADKKIIIPTLAISKENVEEFSAKLKMLRGR